MQIWPQFEETDLNQISSAASRIPHMERLVEILNEVDEESWRLSLRLPRGSRVGQHPLKILDLADDAPLGRAEPGIVARL